MIAGGRRGGLADGCFCCALTEPTAPTATRMAIAKAVRRVRMTLPEVLTGQQYMARRQRLEKGRELPKLERAKGFEPSTLTLAT